MRIAAPMLMYMCSPRLVSEHLPTARLREASLVSVLRRSRQACLWAPAALLPGVLRRSPTSKLDGRVPASALPGGSSLTPSAVLGPTEWGGRVLVLGIRRRLPDGGGTGHPSRRLWARALGRHVAPPPCSLLPGRAPATPGPGHSVRNPRKGSTGQVPCLDVLVEAAHLASSRPVLNRYLPDAVSVTQGLSWSRRTGVDRGSRFQSALLRDRHVVCAGRTRQSAPVPHLRRRKLRGDRPKVLRVAPLG